MRKSGWERSLVMHWSTTPAYSYLAALMFSYGNQPRERWESTSRAKSGKRSLPSKTRTKRKRTSTQYLVWRERFGSFWMAEQIPYYESRRVVDAERQEAERIANLSLEEKHQERLARLGKEYRGVRPATSGLGRRRVTHCYACLRELDNSADIECVACGWILCSCGACGCGYGAF
jgi:hypothetical protein